MTVREYLVSELRPFGVTEAELTDISHSLSVPMDEEYTAGNTEAVRKALAAALPAFILKPRMGSVSENGFSVSWNYDNLTKYYLWLCRSLGIEPDETVAALAGLSVITDKTDAW